MVPPPTAHAVAAWNLAEALMRRWPLPVLGALILASLAGLAGWSHWDHSYTATAQMVRYESPNSEEVFRPRQIAPQTFALMLTSPGLIREASARAPFPISPEEVAATVRVTPEYNSDLLSVTVTASDPQHAVELANLYAHESVRFTQQLQADTASEVASYLQSQLADIENKLEAARREWPSAAPLAARSDGARDSRPLPLVSRWQAAREELSELLTRYTDAHPLVQGQRAKVSALEREVKAMGMPLPDASGATALAASNMPELASAPLATASAQHDPEILRAQWQSLANARLLLAGRLSAARLFEKTPAGYVRLFSEASMEGVAVKSPWTKIAALTILSGSFGLILGIVSVLLSEFTERRLKTAGDIERVAGLPVIATLGDLKKMGPLDRSRWAFRTWTALQSRLSRSPNHGLVCGITSSTEGEGRSTWVKLLARAATDRGFRVLTIATRPSLAHENLANPPIDATNGEVSDFPSPTSSTTDNETALASLLASPAEVAAQLADPNAQSVMHIPLPGWVWNLERRKQWQDAVHAWSRIDNVVIIVELPPASMPEAVLLAENLPNLIWLAGSGQADASETRAQLETLQNARCDLVGAVLNQEPSSPLKNLFPRWLAPIGRQIA